MILLIRLLGTTLFGVAVSLYSHESCENGMVQLPAGVTGSITICSAISKTNPEIAQELAAVRLSLGQQQSQLSDLASMIRKANTVSLNLSVKQQTELLQNILARLGDGKSQDPAQVDQRIAVLSDQFEQVQQQMIKVLSDQKTAATANAALKGQTGDALARLDFQTVANQLDDISQQLKAMNRKLNSMSNKQDEMFDSITDIKNRTAQQQKDAQAAAERQKHLTGNANDLSGGALERVKALGLKFTNDEFSESVRSGLVPAIAAYLDAGMSPHSFYAGSDRFVLNLPAFEGTENFPEILNEFRKHKLNFAYENRHSAPLPGILYSGDQWFYNDAPETLQDELFLTLATGNKGEIALVDGKALLAAGASPVHTLHSAQLCKGGWPQCGQVIDYFSRLGYTSGKSADGRAMTGKQLYLESRYVEALPLLTRDAQNGDGESDGLLANYYAQGLVRLPKDDRIAFGLYQKGATQGDSWSMTGLGEYYFAGLNWLSRDAGRAIGLFQKAAAKGDAQAMTNLGFIYFAGAGIQDDDGVAADWFRKAAKAGGREGIQHLRQVIMSSVQSSLFLNVFQVSDLFRKAVLGDDRKLFHQLGNIFMNGENGLHKNPARANSFFRAEVTGQSIFHGPFYSSYLQQ